MNVTDRIELLLASSGVPKRKIKTTLAKVCGVKYPAVSQWFSGKTKSIRNENLMSIAKAYGSSVDWLISGRGDMITAPDGRNATKSTQNKSETSEINVYPQSFTATPLISWVSAGNWSEVIDVYATGDAEEWMPCPDRIGPRGFALRVEGDSMTSPFPGSESYPRGTVIFVDPDIEAKTGDPVIARLHPDNEATFKMFVRESGRLYLKPLNPQYPLTEISEDVQIIGVIIGSYITRR
ncbi:TPA: LexA family transcriptional regulator [Pseudomonas aeruginosa]|uniref:LexA family transcriptional regulator n=1 Tax=Pseudomonas aeruginosa TaxID=287 RepID=UPI00300582D4